MKLTRVYCPRTLALGAEWTMDEKESRHIVQVMRLRAGDSLTVFNGQGGEYLAEVIGVHKRKAQIKIKQQYVGCPAPQMPIHLGQAVSRGERMDYAIQKSVEMGVSTITPILSERCGVKIDAERGAKRLAHWQGVAISAAEQSGRCEVPEILPICRYEQWLQQVESDRKWIAMPQSEWQDNVEASNEKPQSLTIAIGPEGGFTEQECQLALQQHFQPVQFGPRVLRTETAGVVAIAMAQRAWGELSASIL
ncbi:MAG: 16S rRNA (uracil(1498)-N(3))-methyltransferase [Coxiellaceae bacterium]|nr:16S rRNA (uracil(1498)-N(3))-methyltransferase [Coxiellaceae bacterium]